MNFTNASRTTIRSKAIKQSGVKRVVNFTPLIGRKIRYVASEELTGQETASILGEAIGKPDLKWILATDEQTLQALVDIGMNKQIAAGLVEMNAALQSGLLSEDYFANRPAVLGKVKLKEFAKEFEATYNS